MAKPILPILAAAAALCIHVAPAAAQGTDTISTFTSAELRAALDSIEARHEASAEGKSINVIFANGLRANAVVMACQDQDTQSNCLATSVLATFAKPEDASLGAIMNAINTYNYRQNFGRAYLSPSGDLSIRLYIIADGGIERENYRAQIGLFSASLERFSGYLNPSPGEVE
jgi:hypothetical protein